VCFFVISRDVLYFSFLAISTYGLKIHCDMLLAAAAWTKYHIAVTQQHDNESKAHAAMYDSYYPGSPVVSLENFMDGEILNTSCQSKQQHPGSNDRLASSEIFRLCGSSSRV
jgi:hypothetical protein